MARAAGSEDAGRGAGRSPLALVLVVLAGAALAPAVHPVIGLPVAGSALAALLLSDRRLSAVVAIVLGAGLASAIAAGSMYTVGVPLVGVDLPTFAPYAFATLMVISLSIAGPVTAWLLQRRPALETIAVLAVLLAGAQVAVLSALAAGVGSSLGAYAASATGSLATEAGLSGELAETLVGMWPSALVTTAGFAAMLAVLGVGLAGARQGRSLNRIPALPTLDLDPKTVLLPIGAVALLAVGRWSGSTTVENVGANVLVVARWVFFLQGISVFAGLYQKAKVTRPIRIAGFVFLGITEAFAPLVSLTGLADVWLNIRRLPREGSMPGEPKATSGVD